MVDVEEPGHDRKASRLPVLSQRPAPRSSSVPASPNESVTFPRRHRSLRKPQQSRIPQYTVPVVSIDSSPSPSSKRSTIRQRAEHRRSQELADHSSSSDDHAESEAKRIRLEAENLIDSLSPANIDDLFGRDDEEGIQMEEDNEWDASTEKFEQIERLHLGSLHSPTFLSPELAAPISYLEEMERIVHEGAPRQDVASSRRVAEWVDGVSPGLPSSDERRLTEEDMDWNGKEWNRNRLSDNSGNDDLNQNPVRSLLAGLAASSSKQPKTVQQHNNNEEERTALITTSTDALEASAVLMNKSADLLEAAAVEQQRKRSRETEHSSFEMLDRSEELLESAAELQRKKRRLNQSTEDLNVSMESRRGNRSLALDHSSIEVDDLPRPDEATMAKYPDLPLPHHTIPRDDVTRRTPSPARQETYGRSTAFYGLGSLDDLPEPPPHLQSPPSSGERKEGPLIDLDPLPPPPLDILSRTPIDDVHLPLHIEADIQTITASTITGSHSEQGLLRPQPLHALQLFSPSSEVSPMTPDLPPEPTTPSPLNVDVSSGPPAAATVQEFYDVLERSSVPSVEGRCPSYEESHGHPSSSLLAIVLGRSSQQPKQAQQLFSPSSNIVPDDYEETWLTGPFFKPQPVEATEISSLRSSVQPIEETVFSQPLPTTKIEVKHPLDSELEAFLDPSVPRIESASESEGEGRRPSPLKKSVTFDDDRLWHIIEERDNDYYGLNRTGEEGSEEVLLPATEHPLKTTKRPSEDEQKEMMPLAKKIAVNPSSWKSELESFVADEELAAERENTQPMQQLQPAPVQERNHMASQELEAFLASIKEPEKTEEDETTDSTPEQIPSVEEPIFTTEEEFGNQSTDTMDSKPDLLAPRMPMRSNSVTSTASLILDDVHSMRLPGEKTAEEELERVHRSVAFFQPAPDDGRERLGGIRNKPTTAIGIHLSDEVLLAVERRSNEYYFPRDEPPIERRLPQEIVQRAEEMSPIQYPDIVDEASTADDSSRTGGSFAFKDSARTSSTTSSSSESSSAPTIISSPERDAPVSDREDKATQAPPEVEERVESHGLVNVTIEVEEELQWKRVADAASSPVSFDEIKEVHAVADVQMPMDIDGDSLEHVQSDPVQLLYGHHGLSFKRNPPEEPEGQRSARPQPATVPDRPPLKKEERKQRSPPKQRAPEPIEHSYFIPTFDTRPHAHSIPDLVVEEPPHQEQIKEEEEKETVIEPQSIRPLKIRLPADKSIEEMEEKSSSASPYSGSDSTASPSGEKSDVEVATQDGKQDSSSSTPTREESMEEVSEALSDEASDFIIIEEGQKTPPELQADDVFSEPPLKKPAYTADQAQDLATAAFEKLLEHSHQPGDPLEGAVVTSAYIESDSDLNDESMIKGKRIVLVGKHSNLLPRRLSDDDNEGSVVELVSDEEGGSRTVRDAEQPGDEEVRQIFGMTGSGVERGDGVPAVESNEEEEATGEGVILEATVPMATVGQGTELTDDVLLAIERRSNEYFFPQEEMDSGRKDPSTDFVEDSVRPKRTAKESTASGIASFRDNLIRPTTADETSSPGASSANVPSSPKRDANEAKSTVSASTGGDLSTKADDLEVLGYRNKPPVETASSSPSDEIGRGIHLTDDVLIAVDKRSNDYYFPTDAEEKTTAESHPSFVGKPTSFEAASAMGTSTIDKSPVAVKTAEDVGKGIVLPDQVLIAVDKRSNEYHFPADAGKRTPSNSHSSSFDSVVDAGTSANPIRPSPLIHELAPSRRSEEPADEDIDSLPPPPDYLDERLGTGIHLPDDVLMAVDTRSDEHYFPTDQTTIPSSDNAKSSMHTATNSQQPTAADKNESLTKKIYPATSEELGRGIKLTDDVLRTVEKRSNEYFFANDHENTPVTDRPSSRDFIPAVKKITDNDPSSTAKPSASTTINKVQSAEKTDALNGAKETHGSGIVLPDDVLVEVERRSNDYFFSGDQNKTAATSSPSSEDKSAIRAVPTTQRQPVDRKQTENSTKPSFDFGAVTPAAKTNEGERPRDKPTDASIGRAIGGRNAATADPLMSSDSSRSHFYQSGVKLPQSQSTVPGTGTTAEHGKADPKVAARGIDLPDDVLLEVEQRSNDYFFAPKKNTNTNSSSPMDSGKKPANTTTDQDHTKSNPTDVTHGPRLAHTDGTRVVVQPDSSKTDLADKSAHPPLPAMKTAQDTDMDDIVYGVLHGPGIDLRDEHIPPESALRGSRLGHLPQQPVGYVMANAPVPGKEDDVTVGHGIELPADVQHDVDRRSNRYYLPRDTGTKPVRDFQTEVSKEQPSPGHFSSGYVPSLPPLDEYLFGPEDTDQRTARLFQKVELDARSGTHETIDRPAVLGAPDANQKTTPTVQPSEDVGRGVYIPDDQEPFLLRPDPNEEALFSELTRRTSPRRSSDDLPLDASTPLSNPPRFSPTDLRTLLRPSPTDPTAAYDVHNQYKQQEQQTKPAPFGEVQLISFEEGVERFPLETDIPVQRKLSRSLDASAISVDLPSDLLPSPVAPSYRTPVVDVSGYRPQLFLTEETVRTTVEQLTITERTIHDDRSYEYEIPSQAYYQEEDEYDDHYRQPQSPSRPYVTFPSGSLESLQERYPGVKLVQASDGSFKVPERFETFLSLEPPENNEDNDAVGEDSGASPRDLNVDAAEVAYYRIAQDATPSLESSGEFEGLHQHQSEGGEEHRLMSIQEILRLTDNCDTKSAFGLDVIHEESEAERSARSTRFEVVRIDENKDSEASYEDLNVDTGALRAPESASEVASRLLAGLSPLMVDRETTEDSEDSDSEAEGEVADWGQSVPATATAEPFAHDMDLSEEEEDEGQRKRRTLTQVMEEEKRRRSSVHQTFSIRDFSLSPDAGEVYDSDGLNPSSYREEVERRAGTPEWVIPSRAADDDEESLPAPPEMKKVDDEEYIIASRSVRSVEEENINKNSEDDVDLTQEDESEEEVFVPLPTIGEEQEESIASDSLEDDVTKEEEEPSQISLSPTFEKKHLEDDVLQAVEARSDEYYGLRKPSEATDVIEEEVIYARGDLSDIAKTSEDEFEGPTSTSSSPHDDDAPDTMREGLKLEDDVVREVEARSDAYYGLTSPKPDSVHLVEAEDVSSVRGVTRDDGDVRLVRSRDGMRVENVRKLEEQQDKNEEEKRRTNEQEMEEAADAEVEIRLENESMDSPISNEPSLPHPTIVRLAFDSREPSFDRQSSVASDDLDRSSLVRLKLENNLDRATSSHGERDGELNTTDVERFWEYRYNKSPRTMRAFEEARHRAEEAEEKRRDEEIKKRTLEIGDGARLDEEINRKLAEAESRFLSRDGEKTLTFDAERINSSLSSSSASVLIGRLTPEDDEDENEAGIPLSCSGHFFRVRSSSSSSASSFNSMGEGRQGRMHTLDSYNSIGEGRNERMQRESHGADRLTRDRVGGASLPTTTTTELERLYPYIRHSSYYLNYYRSTNLSMEKQSAPRNDYMLSRGLLRSTSSRDSIGMIRQSASTDFLRDVDGSGRKSVTFRQRIEELVHTPPMMHRRIRPGTSSQQIRSILKSQHASNLLKIANENMVRELEQCVEERDRLAVNISATPADVSQLSPMTQSAQTRYRNHMMDQKERISVLIEDKYSLIKETLREDDMPSWLRGKGDSLTLTLVDHKRNPHRRLFRRQSSSFFYQQQTTYKNGSNAKGADLVTANDCARKLERLRCQFARRESESHIDYGDNASDILSRISQRLSTSPNRLESAYE